ncbi:unnamed protein product [Ceutorhynchus assimilis]|uniref:DUF4780 domain-containing protein n=1 Tax=Ceutorhynchus assimilis TaxID=467358 RepID=A0A9N9M9F0_9CUCU|nr:unnamed protein product [Ceutorhynchus assimilis]
MNEQKSQKSEAPQKSKRLAEKMTAKAKSDGSLKENTVSSKGSKAKSDVYESLNADSKEKNCENRSSSNKTAASARTARSNISRRRKEAEIEAKIKKTALEQEMLKNQQEMVDLELARKLVLIEECDEKEFDDSGEDECESVSSYRANSLEEIDNLTEEEVHKATLSGSSRAKLRNLVTKGKSYTEAKRAVIRENFLNHMEGKGKAKVATKSAESSIAQKRTRSEDSTPQKRQTTNPRGGQIPATTTSKSYKDAAEAQMTIERMQQLQAVISAAHENIPENDPQVRFEKCSHRLGYFEVTCADKISAVWLMETVSTLKLWEGAVLKALTGEDLPKPETCTVFIPDEKGERLSAERILKKLSMENRGLNTEHKPVEVLGRSPNGQRLTVGPLYGQAVARGPGETGHEPLLQIWKAEVQKKAGKEARGQGPPYRRRS